MPGETSPDRDHAQLSEWRAGDRQAGEELFGRHFKDIYRFFGNKVGADADELTQRTFLACLSAREQFRGQSSFRTYLFAIARHELYAYLRRRHGDRATDFSVSSLEALGTSPSGRVARVQQSQRLRDAMRALPVEQQLLLELHYWHELDAGALADVFALPPGTVRVRLTRARQALRETLALAPPPPSFAPSKETVGNDRAQRDSIQPAGAIQPRLSTGVCNRE
jgi:RNA polymerase sigma factor (sigma-70 family)